MGRVRGEEGGRVKEDVGGRGVKKDERPIS